MLNSLISRHSIECRCELCYDHCTHLAALMRHRSLPVVNGSNLLARAEAQGVTGTDVIAYPDGSQYIGDVKESKRHGRGIMLYGRSCCSSRG